VQPFSGPSPARLAIIFFSLRFDAPPTWRDSPPYLYPPKTGVAQFIDIHLHTIKIYIKLRLTLSRPIYLGVRLPSRGHDQIIFLSDNCALLDVGHPFRREDGSVIYSYNCFWALLEQTLGSKPSRNNDHILIYHFRRPGPGGPEPRIYILQEQDHRVMPPDTVSDWTGCSSCGRRSVD
jgi:hypothetical protein